MNKAFGWLLLAGLFLCLIAIEGRPLQASQGQPSMPISGVPVLLYHKITPNPAELSKVCCTSLKSEFEKQLNYLAENGYHTINSDQLYNYLSTGAELPSRPIMITFDDFHESDYEIALPLLLKHHFIGVFFVPSNYVLTEPDRLKGLQSLAQAGMDIESHTVHHYLLAKSVDKTKPMILNIEPKLANRELKYSKDWLEKNLHLRVNYLAWPWGAFNENLLSMAKQAGYKGFFLAQPIWPKYLKTSLTGKQSYFNVYGLDDVDHIKRFIVDSSLSFANWQRILEQRYPQITKD